ncbi:leucine-rich repeat domain-containing protein [Nocardia takedensis]
MALTTTFALRVYRHDFWGIDKLLGDTLGEDGGADLLAACAAGPGGYVRHPDFRIDDRFLESLVAELDRLGLRALSLAGCRRVTGGGLAAVGRLPGLRFLDLFNTEFTDADLAFLTECRDLEVLNLAGTAIDGSVLAALAELPELHTLHLGFTELGPGALGSLARSPKLRTLDLVAAPATDEDVAALAHCGTLVELGLAETQITNAAVAALKPLAAQLSRLDLGYNHLTDDCVADLCAFGALRHLQLRATHVDRAHGDRLRTALAAPGPDGVASALVW